MSTMEMNINYDNLEECLIILEKSNRNFSDLAEEILVIQKEFKSTYSDVDGIADAIRGTERAYYDICEQVLHDEGNAMAMINDIIRRFDSLEKDANGKANVDRDKYLKMLKEFSYSYGIPNSSQSMLGGVLGGAISSMISQAANQVSSDSPDNLTAGITSVMNEALREDEIDPGNSSTTSAEVSTSSASISTSSSGFSSPVASASIPTYQTNATVASTGVLASPVVANASKTARTYIDSTKESVKRKKKKVEKNLVKESIEDLRDDDRNLTYEEVGPKPPMPKPKLPIVEEQIPTPEPGPQVPSADIPPTDIPTDNNNPADNITTENPSVNNDTQPSYTNQSNSGTNLGGVKQTVAVKKPVFAQNSTAVSDSSSGIVGDSVTPITDSINNGNTTDLFDTTTDDFSRFEDSISSVGNNSSTGGSGVIPIVAGLGAAAAVGVGAKIYKDRKENNDLDLNEDRLSNENKFWTTEDSMVIHSEKDEYDGNIDYSVGEDTPSYTAVDNSIDDSQKDTWEISDVDSSNQMIDLLGNE